MTFDSKEDPFAWINKCEHFFRAQCTPDVDKVWLTSFHMNGVAKHWYYMLEGSAGDVSTISCPVFKALCHSRFEPALGTNHLADLACLPFWGSMVDYAEAFQSHMAHAGLLSLAQQVQLFIAGLPNPIRTDIKLQALGNLQRAMGPACAYERRAEVLPGTTSVRPPRPSSRPPLLPLTATSATPTTQPPAPAPTQVLPRPLCHLSPTEMVERPHQGLLYNCDEQYVWGHKCQCLFYLEVTNFTDTEPPLHEEDSNPEELPPLISLHAITGIRTEDTMQLGISIGNMSSQPSSTQVRPTTSSTWQQPGVLASTSR